MTIYVEPMSWEKFFRPPRRGCSWAEKKYSDYRLSVQQYNALLKSDEFSTTDAGRVLAKHMLKEGKVIQEAINGYRAMLLREAEG